MIRFIHTADVHYGMENYGKIDPEKGIHSRLLDFDKAFNFCIDVAIEKQVDFFLFAGDAYKTVNPSPTQQRLLLSALLRLYKADIPIIIVVGNHDNPLSFGKANTLDILGDLPLDGFYVVSKPQIINVETKNGPVQIVGIPWPTRNTITLNDQHIFKSATELTEYISNRVTDIIKHFAQSLDHTIPSILTGHLTVTSGIFSGSEKRAIYGTDPVFMPSQLGIKPFDYVALGHLHRFQDLNAHGYPPIVYSGSIERIDFGERNEEKGFCLVSIPEKGKTFYEFIKTPQRPFIQIEVHLKPDAEQSQTAQILNILATYNLTGAIVKVLYYLHAHQKDLVDLAAIQRACSDAHDIVAILPVHQPKTRSVRSAMKVDMDFTTLLTTYLATKPEHATRSNELIKKALELKDHLDDIHTNSE